MSICLFHFFVYFVRHVTNIALGISENLRFSNSLKNTYTQCYNVQILNNKILVIYITMFVNHLSYSAMVSTYKTPDDLQICADEVRVQSGSNKLDCNTYLKPPSKK